MELSGIGQYLESYRARLFSAEDQKRLLVGIVKQVAGIDIDEKDVSISHTTITIKTDSVTRNHLFLYKNKILNEIKSNSKKVITDIQ